MKRVRTLNQSIKQLYERVNNLRNELAKCERTLSEMMLLIPNEPKHISCFKNGDHIVRVDRSNCYDGSYIGVEFKLLKIKNGQIYLMFISNFDKSFVKKGEVEKFKLCEYDNDWQLWEK